ncbi:hypothetical protein D3C77_782600 [compost metagenome]
MALATPPPAKNRPHSSSTSSSARLNSCAGWRVFSKNTTSRMFSTRYNQLPERSRSSLAEASNRLSMLLEISSTRMMPTLKR